MGSVSRRVLAESACDMLIVQRPGKEPVAHAAPAQMWLTKPPAHADTAAVAERAAAFAGTRLQDDRGLAVAVVWPPPSRRAGAPTSMGAWKCTFDSTAGLDDPVDYATWKLLHQSAVAVSIAGFVARGLGSFVQAGWVRHRVTRIAPHVVDTVLLSSALVMAWTLRLTPSAAPWLVAKIAGLLLYIGLGMLALRPGRPLGLRIAAWMAALAVFGWIVSVAITKQPLGLLAIVRPG